VVPHNSHVGDARATELGQAGELNVGQLVREAAPAPRRCWSISTYTGTVTDGGVELGAARPNGKARPARAHRELGGAVSTRRACRCFRLDTARLDGRRLERAIGVVYRPETERLSHYFHARIAAQLDLVIHMDETRALEAAIERNERVGSGRAARDVSLGV